MSSDWFYIFRLNLRLEINAKWCHKNATRPGRILMYSVLCPFKPRRCLGLKLISSIFTNALLIVIILCLIVPTVLLIGYKDKTHPLGEFFLYMPLVSITWGLGDNLLALWEIYCSRPFLCEKSSLFIKWVIPNYVPDFFFLLGVCQTKLVAFCVWTVGKFLGSNDGWLIRWIFRVSMVHWAYIWYLCHIIQVWWS